eukprot:TRINITY_DN70351_c0_g1_i1.p1 TRINITY_DN70351_c0_g1~~TRINITY_DN70351_c0_g1_i1.p1  ORF type:complete len:1074 (-),score=178.38 TRINITY_DN70351_c0_g1_i1:97-3318(-)
MVVAEPDAAKKSRRNSLSLPSTQTGAPSPRASGHSSHGSHSSGSKRRHSVSGSNSPAPDSPSARQARDQLDGDTSMSTSFTRPSGRSASVDDKIIRKKSQIAPEPESPKEKGQRKSSFDNGKKGDYSLRKKRSTDSTGSGVKRVTIKTDDTFVRQKSSWSEAGASKAGSEPRGKGDDEAAADNHGDISTATASWARGVSSATTTSAASILTSRRPSLTTIMSVVSGGKKEIDELSIASPDSKDGDYSPKEKKQMKKERNEKAAAFVIGVLKDHPDIGIALGFEKTATDLDKVLALSRVESPFMVLRYQGGCDRQLAWKVNKELPKAVAALTVNDEHHSDDDLEAGRRHSTKNGYFYRRFVNWITSHPFLMCSCCFLVPAIGLGAHLWMDAQEQALWNKGECSIAAFHQSSCSNCGFTVRIAIAEGDLGRIPSPSGELEFTDWTPPAEKDEFTGEMRWHSPFNCCGGSGSYNCCEWGIEVEGVFSFCDDWAWRKTYKDDSGNACHDGTWKCVYKVTDSNGVGAGLAVVTELNIDETADPMPWLIALLVLLMCAFCPCCLYAADSVLNLTASNTSDVDEWGSMSYASYIKSFGFYGLAMDIGRYMFEEPSPADELEAEYRQKQAEEGIPVQYDFMKDVSGQSKSAERLDRLRASAYVPSGEYTAPAAGRLVGSGRGHASLHTEKEQKAAKTEDTKKHDESSVASSADLEAHEVVISPADANRGELRQTDEESVPGCVPFADDISESGFSDVSARPPSKNPPEMTVEAPKEAPAKAQDDDKVIVRNVNGNGSKLLARRKSAPDGLNSAQSTPLIVVTNADGKHKLVSRRTAPTEGGRSTTADALLSPKLLPPPQHQGRRRSHSDISSKADEDNGSFNRQTSGASMISGMSSRRRNSFSGSFRAVTPGVDDEPHSPGGRRSAEDELLSPKPKRKNSIMENYAKLAACEATSPDRMTVSRTEPTPMTTPDESMSPLSPGGKKGRRNSSIEKTQTPSRPTSTATSLRPKSQHGLGPDPWSGPQSFGKDCFGRNIPVSTNGTLQQSAPQRSPLVVDPHGPDPSSPGKKRRSSVNQGSARK